MPPSLDGLGLMTDQPVFLALGTDNGAWTKNLSRESAKRFDVVANGRGANIDTLLKRVHNEAIDILSDLGPVPQERAKEFIAALGENKVAIELNTTHQTPSEEFIRQAKDADFKFAFGTANANVAALRRCEYGLQMVQQCKLDWQNFFTPGSWWPKAVERHSA